MTFSEYWPVYLAKKRGFVKDTTLAQYTQLWEDHLSEYFGPVDMDDVKNSTLQGYVDIEIRKGRSVKATRDHIAVLKNILKLRRIDQDLPLVSFSIIWPSRSISSSKPEREKYTDKELEKLIEYCKNSNGHTGIAMNTLSHVPWTVTGPFRERMQKILFHRRSYIYSRSQRSTIVCAWHSGYGKHHGMQSTIII